MNKTTLIGIDLAKNLFHLHAVNSKGEQLWRKKLSRSQLQEFLILHEPVTIAMEACASAHYWGRVCQDNRHQVRLIAPQFVKPFVKSNKNDRNDAMAIWSWSLAGYARWRTL